MFRRKNDPDTWLFFEKGRWIVGDAKSKDRFMCGIPKEAKGLVVQGFPVDFLDGFYKETGNTFNGSAVYAHEDNPDLALHATLEGHWGIFSSLPVKGREDCCALSLMKGIPTPNRSLFWEAKVDGRWKTQEISMIQTLLKDKAGETFFNAKGPLKLAHGERTLRHEFIRITRASGEYKNQLEGEYLLQDYRINGQEAFVKEGGSTDLLMPRMCLLFSSGGQWVVSDAEIEPGYPHLGEEKIEMGAGRVYFSARIGESLPEASRSRTWQNILGGDTLQIFRYFEALSLNNKFDINFIEFLRRLEKFEVERFRKEEGLALTQTPTARVAVSHIAQDRTDLTPNDPSTQRRERLGILRGLQRMLRAGATTLEVGETSVGCKHFGFGLPKSFSGRAVNAKEPEFTNAADMEGCVAVLQWGHCKLLGKIMDKARRAQQAKAVAIIMVNDSDDLPPAVDRSGEAQDITIPVIVVPSTAKAQLKNDVDLKCNLSRLLEHSNV